MMEKKTVTQTFSFHDENKRLLEVLKQKAKENRRTLSAELCLRLEESLKAEALV